jgi:hypothetical protein
LKRWFALSCPICGFRHTLQKFNASMKPILYPVQVVTGGGRAKGFRVEKYLPWSTLPALKQTSAWNSLLCLYNRLGAAYDEYYVTLGFLSPEIKKLLQELQRSYASAYLTDPLPNYDKTYCSGQPQQDMAVRYHEDDYPEAYAHLSNLIEGEQIE